MQQQLVQKQLEENDSRADMFVQSFVNGTEWADEVTAIERLAGNEGADAPSRE